MPLTISILTVFDELYKPFLATSLVGRAQKNNVIDVSVVPFASYAVPKQRIDAPPYGHGVGMLIKPDIVQAAIEDRESKVGKGFRIFFSPQGVKLDQRVLEQAAQEIQRANHLILVAPRYEGVDARVQDEYADLVLSIGDFVLMGGDLPAMVFLEGVLRLIPQVVGRVESVQEDSFSGALVDHSHYTEPYEWLGKKVPDVLRSGNHELMRQWRLKQAAKKTAHDHFDWFRHEQSSQEERVAVWSHIPAHYVALLHADVMIGKDELGTTSVTSLDIHDIARSATTYGFENFFIVTPLVDQQKIVNKLLHFWKTDDGIEYNKTRHDALKNVVIHNTLDDVIALIKERHQQEPLVVATSAREQEHERSISFFDHQKVWQQERPVLIILGTGKGLSDAVIARCDFLLEPIKGFAKFNHLSVRSAAAIIFDRWLGLSKRTVKSLVKKNLNDHKAADTPIFQENL